VIYVVSMDWIYICSLSLHVLTVFTYAHCLYICHVANDVTFDFILITTELMLCCQWCCFLLNFCQFWAYALVSMKFRMLHNMSTCTVFLDMLTEFLWCLYAPSSWSNDDWHVLRPTVFADMLTVFIDAHCFDICSLSLHMLTVLTYAHYFCICSLFWYTLTVFI
jgi:hypothetical protein